MSSTRVIVPVDEQRVREIVREEIAKHDAANSISLGYIGRAAATIVDTRADVADIQQPARSAPSERGRAV